MSMLFGMRDDVAVGAVFGPLRREVHFGVVDTDSTSEVQIITPLDVFFLVNNALASLKFPSLL